MRELFPHRLEAVSFLLVLLYVKAVEREVARHVEIARRASVLSELFEVVAYLFVVVPHWLT